MSLSLSFVCNLSCSWWTKSCTDMCCTYLVCLIALLVSVQVVHLTMLVGAIIIWNLAFQQWFCSCEPDYATTKEEAHELFCASASSNLQIKGGHLHLSEENCLLWLLFICHIFLFIHQFQLAGQFTSNVCTSICICLHLYTHTGTHTYKHTHTAQQDTTSNIQLICRNYCIDMSHPILRLVLPHWCWQLTLVTFHWPNSWWRRTTVMWMRRIVMWVDGKQWEECLTAQLVLVPVVTNRLRELEHKMHNKFKWSQTQYWQFTEVVLCYKCSSVTLHSIVE